MQNIFLDTSIFIKENFLEGRRINELLRLSEEKRIKIVLTRITINEIKNNYRKHVEKAIEYHNKFKKEFESRVLRNNEIGKQLFFKANKEELLTDFTSKFELAIANANVEILEYTTLDISPIFDKYFEAVFPFNSSTKKSEFPDAFTLALLEKWCELNTVSCTVFAMDNDLRGYISDFLEVEENFENYLDTTLKDILMAEERIKALEKLFILNLKSIKSAITKWYIEQLYDETAYSRVIWVDIHDIHQPEVTVLKGATYQVTAIDEENIEVEVEFEVEYNVTLTIDDENYSYYDDDDKRVIYYQTTEYRIERQHSGSLNALAFIKSQDEYDIEMEILDINKDQEFEIEGDYDYYG